MGNSSVVQKLQLLEKNKAWLRLEPKQKFHWVQKATVTRSGAYTLTGCGREISLPSAELEAVEVIALVPVQEPVCMHCKRLFWQLTRARVQRHNKQ